MNGTPLIEYIINTGTPTVHHTVHQRYTIRYTLNNTLNTLNTKILKPTQNKNFEFAPLFLGLKFKKTEPSPGIKLCCPPSPGGRFFSAL